MFYVRIKKLFPTIIPVTPSYLEQRYLYSLPTFVLCNTEYTVYMYPLLSSPDIYTVYMYPLLSSPDIFDDKAYLIMGGCMIALKQPLNKHVCGSVSQALFSNIKIFSFTNKCSYLSGHLSEYAYGQLKPKHI